VDELLASAGWTKDAISAQTFVRILDSIERIDYLMMSANARRRENLHQLERSATRREGLRRVAGNVEEADFTDVQKITRRVRHDEHAPTGG
jgi:hypothetical protein